MRNDQSNKNQKKFFLNYQIHLLEMIAQGVSSTEILNSLCLTLENKLIGSVCTILLLDEDGIHVRHGANPSIPKAYVDAIDGSPIGPQACCCGTAMYTRKSVLVSDIKNDPLWKNYYQLALDHNLLSCCSMPIFGSLNEVLGSFAIYYHEIHRFLEPEVKLLKSVTGLTSIVIQNLRREENLTLFKTAVENANDSILITTADLNFPGPKITFVNPAFISLTGYTASEVIGKTPRILQGPKTNRALMDTLKESLSQGKSFRGEDINYRKDGTEIYLELDISPIRNQSKKITHFISIQHDITQKKKSELEKIWYFERDKATHAIAMAAKQRLEFLLEATNTLIDTPFDTKEKIKKLAANMVPRIADWCSIDLVDENGRLNLVVFEHCIPSKIELGRELYAKCKKLQSSKLLSSQVISTGKPIFIPSVQDIQLVEYSQDADHLRLLRSLELRSMIIIPIKTRNKTLGIMSLATSSNSNRRYGLDDLELAQDTAYRAGIAIENENLFNQAQLAIRAREDIIAIVSHDLKNPLTAILINIEMILSKLLPDNQSFKLIQKGMDIILYSAKRMQSLIEGLLDIACFEAGHFKLATEPVDILNIINESIKSMEPLISKNGLTVKKSLLYSEHIIKADRSRILQALSNLLGNAVKFTPRGGIITIQSELSNGYVKTSISDTGPGISENELVHLFERYWKGKRDPKKGTGLGLFITKEIIEAHRGKIWINSTLGKGTTVYFLLPSEKK